MFLALYAFGSGELLSLMSYCESWQVDAFAAWERKVSVSVYVWNLEIGWRASYSFSDCGLLEILAADYLSFRTGRGCVSSRWPSQIEVSRITYRHHLCLL